MTSSSRSDGPEAPEKTSPEDAGTGAPGFAGTAPGAADTAGTGERNRLEAAAAALAATGRAAGSGGTTGSGATPVASGVSSSTSGSVVQPGATPVPTPGSDPYLGRVLDGRYRIDRRLGTGGMGAVFAGEHLALRKRVAIKVIKKDLAGNDDVAARFAREALASARLDHPNVATALDSGTLEEGGAYAGNYRGVHRLNKDEDGRVKCVACFMCSTACPANCIHIVAEESPWDDREKYPTQFDIDELRCIYCGMCEEACPVDAVELTPEYAIVGLTRNEMIFDKAKLLEVFDQTIDQKPM